MNSTKTNKPKQRFIRLAEVIHKTGHSRSKIYTLLDAGKFPERVTLGPMSVAWVESEVDAYIESLIRKRDAKA